MEPLKAPGERAEGGNGLRKGVLEAWVGDRLQWRSAIHLKARLKEDEVEDFGPRAKDPRFSTRSHRTTWTVSAATPSLWLGRMPS